MSNQVSNFGDFFRGPEKLGLTRTTPSLVVSREFNPLSPNGDQYKISPCDANVYSTPKVIRIKDIINQGEFS